MLVSNWDGAPICTPSDVRANLRGIDFSNIPIPLEDEDPTAIMLCKRATKRAMTYCQRIFEATDYVADRYDGTGRNGNITLRNYPVISLTNITAWDAFRTTNRMYSSTDENKLFSLERDYGIIELIPTALDWLLTFTYPDIEDGFSTPGFPSFRWNIEVTYRAGYETYPSDLIYAVSLIASGMILAEVSASKSDGVSSFSADGLSVSFGEGPYAARMKWLTQEAKTILDEGYRRRLIGYL